MLSKYLLNWFENQLDWDFYKLIHNYYSESIFLLALVSPLKNERYCQFYGCLEEKNGKIQPLNKMILFSRMAPKLPLWKVKPAFFKVSRSASVSTTDITRACFLGHPRRPGQLLAPVDSGSMGWSHQTELVTWTELGGRHTQEIFSSAASPPREKSDNLSAPIWGQPSMSYFLQWLTCIRIRINQNGNAEKTEIKRSILENSPGYFKNIVSVDLTWCRNSSICCISFFPRCILQFKHRSSIGYNVC